METTETKQAPPAAFRCHHIKDNGLRCGSPALRNQAFCYFHSRAHRTLIDPRKDPATFIPLLESGDSMKLAMTNIARAVVSGHLEPSQAQCIFNGMQLLKTAFQNAGVATGPAAVKQYTYGMADVLGVGHDDILTPTENVEVNEALNEEVNEGVKKVGVVNGGVPHPLRAAKGWDLGDNTTSDSIIDSMINDLVTNPTSNFARDLASLSASADHAPVKPTLTRSQLKHLKSIIRRGPSHPQFAACSRQLDAHISSS